MARVTEELRERFKPILCDHALSQMWMYKYDSSLHSGTAIHADDASVNINLWISGMAHAAVCSEFHALHGNSDPVACLCATWFG